MYIHTIGDDKMDVDSTSLPFDCGDTHLVPGIFASSLFYNSFCVAFQVLCIKRPGADKRKNPSASGLGGCWLAAQSADPLASLEEILSITVFYN